MGESKIWALFPLCLIWLIWRERNRRHFDGIESTMYRLKTFLFWISLFSWESRESNPTLEQYLDFMDLSHSHCGV